VEAERWAGHCQQWLLRGGGAPRTLESLSDRLDALFEAASEAGDERAEEILSALADHLGSLLP
jgi:exodeoxyribonuclease I